MVILEKNIKCTQKFLMGRPEYEKSKIKVGWLRHQHFISVSIIVIL